MSTTSSLQKLTGPSQRSSLYIVSNRLPITITESHDHKLDLKMSSGGLVAGLREIHKRQPYTWVGYGGSSIADPALLAQLEKQLARRRLLTVPLAADLYQRYYNGISNETIWPLFHYFAANIRFAYSDWQAYEAVNKAFADTLLPYLQEGDWVWVHDYHLMLLPKLLRANKKNLHIAYFHHIPFPSSDIFRVLPPREEILHGLLGADLIGFHSFDYARHFLSSVSRLLGYEIYIDDVYVDNRHAKVGVFPLGVDFKNITKQLKKLQASKAHSQIATAVGTPYIFLGVDRLDYTKGIPERICAFREFLQDHPDYVGQVSLVQLCVPTRADIKTYHDLKAKVERLVSEINGEFASLSYTPIHYLYQNLSPAEVVALYKASHVALVTPLRDGLNLVAKEYVASRDDFDGVLILSEFAGASVEMGEALWVNPYDIKRMAQSMYQAITMPREERQQRMRQLRERVQTYDNLAWSQTFMEVWSKCATASRLKSTPLKEATQEKLIAQLSQGKRIFIFCDNDGTLTPIHPRAEQAIPDEDTLSLLRQLSQLPFVIFTLVTGRPTSYCDRYFHQLRLNIFAEHGAFFKALSQSRWRKRLLLDEFKLVKAEILPVLEMYVKSVQGSHIEEKSSCLVWHYRNADSHFAENQAKALTESLLQLLQNTSYTPVVGKKIVEVRSRLANKGQALKQILDDLSWQEGDVLITIGDDTTDEDMYREYLAFNTSIHVGKPNSKAKYFLRDPQEVKGFFQKLYLACSARCQQSLKAGASHRRAIDYLTKGPDLLSP